MGQAFIDYTLIDYRALKRRFELRREQARLAEQKLPPLEIMSEPVEIPPGEAVPIPGINLVNDGDRAIVYFRCGQHHVCEWAPA